MSKQEVGWCHAERLRTGKDVVVEIGPGYVITRCVGDFSSTNIAAGKWILWNPAGKCLAIGSEAWVRSKASSERP